MAKILIFNMKKVVKAFIYKISILLYTKSGLSSKSPAQAQYLSFLVPQVSEIK